MRRRHFAKPIVRVPDAEGLKEAVFSAGLVAAGAVLLYETYQIIQPSQHTRTFPFVCSLILIVGGAIGFIRCFVPALAFGAAQPLVAPEPAEDGDLQQFDAKVHPALPTGHPKNAVLGACRAFVAALVRLPEWLSHELARRIPRRVYGAVAALDKLIPKPLLLGAMILGYIYALPILHYKLATALFGVVLMWVFEKKLRLVAIGYSIGIAFLLYWLFGHVLSVRLP